MKILHTADWHLGQTFYEYSRYDEHVRFLDWLRRQIKERKIDVLLVAGDTFGDSGSTLVQTLTAVVAAIVGLDENSVSKVLHTVANLSLDAHIGNLTIAVVIGSGTISAKRVTVAVCVTYRHQGYKVDFVLQGIRHFYSSSLVIVLFSAPASCVAFFFLLWAKNSFL